MSLFVLLLGPVSMVMTGAPRWWLGPAGRGHGGDLHGLHQTPEQIVDTAIAEDADAIGMSVLSGRT